MPAISVIIPCYNSHQYLPEAITSIQDQTFENWEIIIVNDGSTDPETLLYLKKAEQFVKVLHKKNGGLASARNFGIAHCNSDIIVALDSDDKFDKTFLQKAYDILKKYNSIGVVSSYVQEFGISSKVWRVTASDDFSFFTENRIVACCAFRKQCWLDVGGYDEEMRNGMEDWEFWIRVTRQGWKVHIIKEKLFFYRKAASSMLVDETRPKMDAILDYMIKKHLEWYIASLKKGIIEKRLLNKNNLTIRRIIGLLIEKLTKKF